MSTTAATIYRRTVQAELGSSHEHEMADVLLQNPSMLDDAQHHRSALMAAGYDLDQIDNHIEAAVRIAKARLEEQSLQKIANAVEASLSGNPTPGQMGELSAHGIMRMYETVAESLEAAGVATVDYARSAMDRAMETQAELIKLAAQMRERGKVEQSRLIECAALTNDAATSAQGIQKKFVNGG